MLFELLQVQLLIALSSMYPYDYLSTYFSNRDPLVLVVSIRDTTAAGFNLEGRSRGGGGDNYPI